MTTRFSLREATAWVLAILAIVGALGLAGVQPQSYASPTCPNHFVDPSVSPDCYFLWVLYGNGRGINALSPQQQSELIGQAHEVCKAEDQSTRQQVVVSAGLPLVQRKHPDWSLGDAARFVGLATTAYCSWNNNR